MNLRHVFGADPRICLWESSAERCARLPAPVTANGDWASLKATVTPDQGTTALDVYLYADVYVPHTLTQNDYANLQIRELPSLPQFDILGTPSDNGHPPRLLLDQSSYSSNWQGPSGSKHVLVDGLTNGWILTNDSVLAPRYLPDMAVRASFFVTAIAALALFGLVVSSASWGGALWRLRAHRGAP
jgi:hypothetical protein